MKKGIAALIACTIILTGMSPSAVYADEKFQKNVQLETQISQTINLDGMSEEEKAAARREETLSRNYKTVDELFDQAFYEKHYPKTVKKLGKDRKVLLRNFLKKGLKNKERCSELLDLVNYRAEYDDLDLAFGDNWDLYVAHFFSIGVYEGRWNGIDQRKPASDIHTDWVYDNQGNVLIPWEESLYNGRSNTKESKPASKQTEPKAAGPDQSQDLKHPVEQYTQWKNIEELKRHFGNELMLLERNGEVLFIGGNFTNIRVRDAESAKQALDSIKKLTHFPDELTALYLTLTTRDASGAVYYRFSGRAKDADGKESNYLFSKSDVILGADSDGRVLCMSTSASSAFKEDISGDELKLFDLDLEKWEAFKPELAEYGVLRTEVPVLRYFTVNNENRFKWVFAAEKDGRVTEYPIQYEGNDSRNLYEIVPDSIFYKTYSAETYGTQEAYANDYLIRAGEGQRHMEMDFTDAYGNTVILPVMWDEEKQAFYICDEKRKLVCVDNVIKWNAKHTDLINEDTYAPYYFTDPGEIDGRYITAIQFVRHVMDAYSSFGYTDPNQSVLISINDRLNYRNADATEMFGSTWIDLYDCDFTTAYDVFAHEITHTVVRGMTGNLAYVNAAGAANEAYADILGNLLEMMTYQKLLKNPEIELELRDVDLDEWYIGEASEQYSKTHGSDEAHAGLIIRSMSNPNEMDQPAQFGSLDYIVDGSEEDTISDHGGVHSNSGLLNAVAYRMYQKAGLSMQEIFTIWYDTIPLLTEDVSYYKIEQCLLYVMKQKKIDVETRKIVEECFTEAGITESTPDQTSWHTLVPLEKTKVVMIEVCTTEQNESDLQSIYLFMLGHDDYQMLYRDTEGTYGYIVEEKRFGEGQTGQIALMYEYVTEAGEEKSGRVRSDQIVFDPAVRLKMDLRDANAKLLTVLESGGEREEFLKACEAAEKEKAAHTSSYQQTEFDADYARVRFLLVDAEGCILKNCTLTLLRDTEDVNVTFAIDAVPSEDSQEKGASQSAFLIKNQLYRFIVKDLDTRDEIAAGVDSIRVGEEKEQRVRIMLDRTQRTAEAVNKPDAEPGEDNSFKEENTTSTQDINRSYNESATETEAVQEESGTVPEPTDTEAAEIQIAAEEGVAETEVPEEQNVSDQVNADTEAQDMWELADTAEILYEAEVKEADQM